MAEPDSSPNADLKAKMREALEKKNDQEKGVHEDTPLHEKAHHGPEVIDNAPMGHLRKAGGGGS